MLESELPQPQEKAMDWILYEESVMTPDPQEPEADFFSSQEEATHVSPEVPESTTFEKDVTIAEPNSAVLDKRRSLVWKEFLMIDMVECTDGKSRCICKHCQSSSFIANSRYGTGNMKRRLSKCTPYQNSLKNKGGATVQKYDDKEASSSHGERSMLDVYLEDPKLDRTTKLDVLAYWKENELRYKELSCLARDILAVPLTTVASESTFSIGGRILNKWRSCYLPENVEALITTRSWMFSYESNEEDTFVGSYVDWAATTSHV